MRFVALALVLVLGACAASVAQPVSNSQPTPLWRVHTEHLADDRVLVRGCLDRGEDSCQAIVQRACQDATSDEWTLGSQRQCDWRASAAWEDEMDAILTWLRAHLRDDDLARLEQSQRAWSASMLSDVGLVMAYYESGSLSGPVGAHVRARAVAQRTQYLNDLRALAEE
jgi:uncharacterized protein YecT (DUF1311 family)